MTPFWTILQILFWACLGGILYAYFGYPLLLAAVARLRRWPPPAPTDEPSVAVIVAAHNEEAQLADKLHNVLALVYPRDRVEFVVASDGSTDRTVAIAESFAGHGVRVVDSGHRQGKEAAQRMAVAATRGEIIVFTDCGTRTQPGTLRAMTRRFADPTVGCVSSVDRHVQSGPVGGEGAYLRYEMMLRDLESRAGSLVGLSGSLFAVRRTVTARWSERMPSDFYLILEAIRQGFRGVSEPEAIGLYQPVHDEGREFHRKVRTVVRGMAALADSIDLLNPFRHGFFALQLVSHKLMRWLVPVFLAVLFGLSLALIPVHPVYAAAFVLQLLFYTLALLGWVTEARTILLRLPFWFCLFNGSILAAGWRFLRGERIVLWEPTRR